MNPEGKNYYMKVSKRAGATMKDEGLQIRSHVLANMNNVTRVWEARALTFVSPGIVLG